MFAENFFIMCRSEWIPTSRAYPVFYFRIGYGADEIGAVLAHGAGLAELCTESGLILRAGDEGSLSHDLVPFYIAFYGASQASACLVRILSTPAGERLEEPYFAVFQRVKIDSDRAVLPPARQTEYLHLSSSRR